MHTTTRPDAVESIGIAGPLSLVVLAVGLGGLALDVPGTWLAFPVGYGAVVPMAIHWHRRRGRAGGSTRNERRARGRTDEDDAALSTLRERYARGELDDAEFEARVEGLVETEDTGLEGRR